MAQPRADLSALLKEIVGAPAEGMVYFQEPANVQMKFPCIVYDLSDRETEKANNGVYSLMKRYTLTVISPDPDSPIPDKVAALPMCAQSTHFVANQHHHTVFDIFF